MFARKIVAGGAGLFLIAAGAVAATSAHAAGACVVTTGHVTTNQPITATTGGNGGAFTSTSITCQSSDPNVTGTWNGISATFSAGAVTPAANPQNCASEQGSGHFTAGSSPATSSYGSINGGDFTFVRVGSHVHVTGNITATNGPAGGLPFTAELEFAPDGTQNCVTGITSASLQGAAQVG